MIIIGAFIGLSISTVLYVTSAAFLGISVVIFGAIAQVITSAFITPLLGTLTATSWLVVAFFSVGIFYIFAYIIASLGVLPGLAGLAVPPAPAAPIPLPAAPPLLARGFMIGLTAGLNFAIWALFPLALAWTVGALLAIIGLLAVFAALARSVPYQAILGWSSCAADVMACDCVRPNPVHT